MPSVSSTTKRLLAAALAVGCLFAAGPGRADTYPSRPITLVVPFVPGVPIDLAARRLGQALTEILRQPVVIENRPGAGGIPGSTYVSKATPDGYTLLAATQSTHAINVGLYKSLPYDPIKDFTPISRISTAPNVLVVNPGLKVKTLAELIALAKKRAAEGKPLTFASGGNGTTSHIAPELLKQAAGIDLVHIPYKGSSQGVMDVISGQVDMVFGPIAVVRGFVDKGALDALVITSDKRSPLMPQVPTVDEAGLKSAEMSVWMAIYAPPGTPEPIIAILSKAINEAGEVKSLKEGFIADGSDVVTDKSPADFVKFNKEEIDRWVKVVKASGATVD
ncbi:tripartite tricarboxylate transporter substrate binding protein [Aquabacter sp. CN5-332]|uniref:Bug family tripartite tricarboxylate transporter substrate binding protein n=1 Tax=Aquabacter sp. CN5-332 TaxID=3156608 RepID=UPI0032B3B7C6